MWAGGSADGGGVRCRWNRRTTARATRRVSDHALLSTPVARAPATTPTTMALAGQYAGGLVVRSDDRGYFRRTSSWCINQRSTTSNVCVVVVVFLINRSNAKMFCG